MQCNLKSTLQKYFTICPMGTDQFLSQISTLIFGWEIVDFVTMINQNSTSQPKINQKSTNCQPNFNHFSTLIFQLQTWLIFGWIVVEKLIFGWSLLQNQRFLNQISTLRMVEESWGSTLIQRWEVDLCPLGNLIFYFVFTTFMPWIQYQDDMDFSLMKWYEFAQTK